MGMNFSLLHIPDTPNPGLHGKVISGTMIIRKERLVNLQALVDVRIVVLCKTLSACIVNCQARGPWLDDCQYLLSTFSRLDWGYMSLR